jgi:glycerophosphoryl diester phosphodiesterase
VRTWINTLAVSHPVEYTDKAALKNPDLVWGKLLESGFSAIQTDESQALLDYLRKKGRHK